MHHIVSAAVLRLFVFLFAVYLSNVAVAFGSKEIRTGRYLLLETPKVVDNTGIEFFKDKSFVVLANGVGNTGYGDFGSGMQGTWLQLDDGRAKLSMQLAGTTVAAFAKIESDDKIEIDWGKSKRRQYVRDGSNLAKDLRAQSDLLTNVKARLFSALGKAVDARDAATWNFSEVVPLAHQACELGALYCGTYGLYATHPQNKINRDVKRAIAQLQSWGNKWPDSYDIASSQAIIYATTPDTSVRSVTKARSIAQSLSKPADLSSWVHEYRLGMIYAGMQMRTEATEHLGRAVRECPSASWKTAEIRKTQCTNLDRRTKVIQKRLDAGRPFIFDEGTAIEMG